MEEIRLTAVRLFFAGANVYTAASELEVCPKALLKECV